VKLILYAGLDVDTGTIAVAVAKGWRYVGVRGRGAITRQLKAIRMRVEKLREQGETGACQEAGPHRRLT